MPNSQLLNAKMYFHRICEPENEEVYTLYYSLYLDRLS